MKKKKILEEEKVINEAVNSELEETPAHERAESREEKKIILETASADLGDHPRLDPFEFLGTVYGKFVIEQGLTAAVASYAFKTGWKKYPQAFYAIATNTQLDPDGLPFIQPGAPLILLTNSKKRKNAFLRYEDFPVDLLDRASIADLKKKLNATNSIDSGELISPK